MITILYSILSFIILRDIYFSYRRSRINYYLIYLTYFFISIVLQGLLLNIDSLSFDSKLGIVQYYFLQYEYIIFLLVFSFYIFVRIGYTKGSNISLNKTDYSSDKLSSIIEYITFSVFILSIYIYSTAHGGIMGMLEDAQTFRAGHGDYSSVDFFKRFFYIGQIPFVMALYKIVKRKFTIINFVYLILLLGLNIIAMLALAGRTNLILLLIISFIVISDGRIYKKVAIYSIVIFYAIVQFGDTLFVSLRDGIDTKNLSETYSNTNTTFETIQNFIFEFQYPFLSLGQTINKYDEINLRYGIDIPYAILNLLPDKLLPVGRYDTLAYHNTEMVTGIYNSTVPPGIITFSIYSFGILGLILMAFLFGLILKKVELWFLNFNQSFINVTFYYITAFKIGGFVLSGEPRVFMYSFFMILVMYLLYRYIYVRNFRLIR